ncbi:hypothetical protein EDB81DRAFT_661985 [Dactylonectria macrodidyma]|uniref:NmrA-like domain-containing protein n=1 Tax=Dactylonectria macrodidyma TaxID=307937 RepID=A0A9P9IS59_9HYPO|nr:hypothetical protein EDB81DRAFT_661985 [Dactylonectria macrodidyma]
MSRVAIAGGTGGLGVTIIEAIIACKKHNVFVLSRNETDAFLKQPEVTVLIIDYLSPENIADVLRENAIDTVISCLSMNTEEAGQAQLNLIEGAVKSTTVRRFAPSDNYPFPSTEPKVAAVKKLREVPTMNYTRFVNGTFMDYFGPPQAPSYLNVISLIVDHEHRKAAVPGDGNSLVVLTHSTDVARFVAASLDLEKWPEASFIRGDKLTIDELVALAETSKGCKFDVSYDTVADLKAGKSTELPVNVQRYAFLPKAVIDNISQTAGLAMVNGWLDLNGSLLNDRFPELQPMSVKSFFEKYKA